MSVSLPFKSRRLIERSGVSGVAEANLEGGILNNTSTSATATHENDLIWAVRLCKVTKGLLDKIWTHKTFSKGATFGMEDGEDLLESVLNVLSEEDLDFKGILGIQSSQDTEVAVII